MKNVSRVKSVSIVIEVSENCFQTHEKTREKNEVIPVRIEQMYFVKLSANFSIDDSRNFYVTFPLLRCRHDILQLSKL